MHQVFLPSRGRLRLFFGEDKHWNSFSLLRLLDSWRWAGQTARERCWPTTNQRCVTSKKSENLSFKRN